MIPKTLKLAAGFALMLIIALTLLNSTGASASAATAQATGIGDLFTVGDGIIYEVATIAGNTGTARVFKGESAIVGGVLAIPATATYEGVTYSVTALGDEAFYRCASLTKIILGDNVTRIGDCAFYQCSNLASVENAGSVTHIGENAFYQCYGLAAFESTDSVASIGYGAFAYCLSLADFRIPDGVTAISAYAFNYSGLVSVAIPGSVTDVGSAAFAHCPDLVSVIVENGIIGYAAFYNCESLASVIIGDGVTFVGEYAFWECYNLSYVSIGNGVTDIGYGSFAYCDGLYEITIPAGVARIGSFAFYSCRNLNIFYFDGDAPTAGDDAFLDIYSGAIAFVYPSAHGFPDEGWIWIDLIVIYRSEGEGVDVSGVVRSYNPKNPVTLQLVKDGEVAYTTTIQADKGSDLVVQPFTFSGVAPGTYSLVINKIVHTKFTVLSVEVGDQDVDLTNDSRPAVRVMNLLCGDINGDGMINDSDLTALWMTSNYNKSAEGASDSLADLNGDGMVNDSDLTILWMTTNYNKGRVVIE